MSNIGRLLPKIMFNFSLAACFFAYGAYAYKNWVFPVPQLKNGVENLKLTLSELGTIASFHPAHFLQPAREEGEGVTINKLPASNTDVLMLSGFFGQDNGLRLLKRNGEVLAQWDVRFSEIFPDTSHLNYPPQTDWNIDLHGALVNPDGSVVFNFEYGGVVKMDKCGEVAWTIPTLAHHSIEKAEAGGYWVPGRTEHNVDGVAEFPPFQLPYNEDTILHISENGEILHEISVPKLFYKSGLESLLTAGGELYTRDMLWDNEIVHVNKIAELSTELAASFPQFEAGDLMLSLRQYNMVLVVDPKTETIKWWQVGPWVRQHDPEFMHNGKLAVFNNNAYRAAFKSSTDTVSELSIPRTTNIIEIDPQTRKTKILYGEKPDQQLLTVVRGKLEHTKDDTLLITEFEGGRILEIDASGDIVWEYINRYDADHVAELTEARVYPADYFNVSNWQCN